MNRDSDILLDHVLRPSPPMAPRTLRNILYVVIAINLGFALFFLAHGAWPIMPFLGLDVALLAWAFRASSEAAKREEHVTLTPAQLSIVRKPPRGPSNEIRLNPYWVRVQMDDPPEHWSQLWLWSHGKDLKIGTFLAPTERAAFAGVLKSALRRARNG
jgi:uncharacterized membrane protein